MRQKIQGVCLFALLLTVSLLLKAGFNFLFAQSKISKVNPFIGTDGGGNVHPGATVPWGMIALTPRTEERGWGNMGYRKENKFILGFVHNQVSGVGSGEYGNFLLMPARGATELVRDKEYSSRESEVASPGYYKVFLTKPKVTVELTANESIGYHRYTFDDSSSDTLKIIFNASEASHPQTVSSAESEYDPKRNELRCTAVYTGGFGELPSDFRAYFVASFSEKPVAVHYWKNGGIITSNNEPNRSESNEESGIVVSFLPKKNRKSIEVIASVSYLNFESAKKKIDDTKRKKQSFDQTRKSAELTWESYLNRISIEGATKETETIFYTALYHSLLMPTRLNEWEKDKAGTFKKTHAYTNYFAIWDIYRTLSPFLSLILPSIQRDMLNALIDIGNQYGWLPDGFTGNAFTPMQGGTNADVLFADAAVKDLPGVRYEEAFQLVLKNGFIPGDEPNLKSTRAFRGKPRQYLESGWLGADEMWQSVSKSLEFAYNDFALWSFGKKIKKESEVAFAFERSQKIFALFDSTTGFFRPKNRNGEWVENFKPEFVFPEGLFWSAEVHYYEGSAWQYLGYVPHDPYGLISRLGGDRAFVEKWDFFFNHRSNRDYTKGYFSVSNEPDMLAPFLYIYAKRADRTQFWTNLILQENFDTTAAGLPGNDDSGTTSAWFLFSSLGLFPVAGQPIYLLTSPQFQNASLTLENGKKLTIRCTNKTKENIYIKSLKLNGKSINRAWLMHDEIKNGATLEFTLSSIPTDFGNSELPPNPIH
ncbi:MAG: GH92 family glycosyl hydrolase [Chloroherpetonaceae bacterium]|nr:GH92 family glycosyl hydrolase [Chloroherpetonaceae bacterium]